MRKHYVSRFVNDSSIRRIVGRLDLDLLESGFAAAYQSWLQMSFSSESYFRIYHVISGRANLRFANGLFALHPEHTYLIPANVPFKFEPETPLEHYWLHVASSTMENILWLNQPHIIKAGSNVEIEEKMEKMLRLSMHQNDAVALFEMDMIIRQLLAPLISEFLNNESPDVLVNLDLLSQVVDYIDRNLDRDVTIPEIAAIVRMNRNDFSKKFHQTFGIPPKQYICRRRVDRAKNLLIRTRFPIKQIAAEVGYSDEFYFYRIFKKYARMTPDEYRQNNNPCL